MPAAILKTSLVVVSAARELTFGEFTGALWAGAGTMVADAVPRRRRWQRTGRDSMTLSEIVFPGAGLLILALLVLDLVGVLHRGIGFRVQAAGLLVMDTAEVVSVLGHLHSRGIFPGLFVGFAIFGIGLVISSRARHAA